MSISLSQLNERQRKMIAPKDRDILGKEAETFADAQKRGEARSEKQLQRQIVSLLRLRGIEPILSRMDRKTSNNLGTPDLLFAVLGFNNIHRWTAPRVFACAWEVKMPGKRLEPHQTAFAKLMSQSPNHWRHRVITSVDMAIKEINEMGIE